MHDLPGQFGVICKAQPWQQLRQEIRTAAHVRQRELRAICCTLVFASNVPRVMEQGDDHAKHGSARSEAVGCCDAALMAIEQPRISQGAVQTVLRVVIPGVTAVIPRVGPRIQTGEDLGRAIYSPEIRLRMQVADETHDLAADITGVRDSHRVGHIVMISSIRFHSSLLRRLVVNQRIDRHKM